MNNLRQLGVALIVYAGSYGEYLPLGVRPRDEGGGGGYEAEQPHSTAGNWLCQLMDMDPGLWPCFAAIPGSGNDHGNSAQY